MEAFVSRKRQRTSEEDDPGSTGTVPTWTNGDTNDTTDEKLAILVSIFEDKPYEELLVALRDCEGSVERATDFLLSAATLVNSPQRPFKDSGIPGIQSSLSFKRPKTGTASTSDHVSKSSGPSKSLTSKGRTLYLYDPQEIAKQTPCTIIHNFLPSQLANDLIRELLPQAASFGSATFRLFDQVVSSPHTACMYLRTFREAEAQKNYLYNGSTLSDVREIPPVMRNVSEIVQRRVNEEIEKRIKTYPGQQKLKYQPPPGLWEPNAAFVNCYDGPQQSVGWHTDQLTYLGPHATIGSLSLGVQREFRIRRIVPQPDPDDFRDDPAGLKKAQDEVGDLQGQISLPLPHNSLLIMHAEMQETWKHSIAPISITGRGKTGGLVPHPISDNKRLNITYRWYREEFTPRYTPRCRCKDRNGQGIPCVLKSVMRRKSTAGQYMWMCQTPSRVDEDDETSEKNAVSSKGCGYFEWAEFDEHGVPSGWTKAKEDQEGGPEDSKDRSEGEGSS